uniref:Uncharacterized protein n=1 Tax=Anguilla anguilla TaxID=7936 RepID=A0A0E9QT81_ANGAN
MREQGLMNTIIGGASVSCQSLHSSQ